MNEFVEQFLIETRELVDQATDDLLALESDPLDGERLDGAFRAFHTLKGSAAIVDFDAMARALHAVEDVLSGVRAAAAPISTVVVSDCLWSLDQVIQWLDVMQVSGEPPEDADKMADAIIARFARDSGPATDSALVGGPAGADWIAHLLARRPGDRARARTAVRYTPDADSFFRGEDPIATIQQLPGLIALALEPNGTLSGLETLDPFQCNLVLMALTTSSAADLAAVLDMLGDQAEVRSLDTDGKVLAPIARSLIEAQIALLQETNDEGGAGRMGAAAKVAANVFRHAGISQFAAEVERVYDACRAAGDPALLIATLIDIIKGEFAVRVTEQAVTPAAAPEPAALALRVDVARIDALVRLTGELTIVQNAVGHVVVLAQSRADVSLIAAKLKEQHGLLERLVGELQRSVLNIRVLPLRHVFQRFPRLVRDSAAKLGKPIRLLIEGDETEADKAVVENLFDPLLHVLRNAIDHGVEPPEERAALGKPETSTLFLRAWRRGEYVVIEVADDGGGMNVDLIRQVAGVRNVVSAERLAAMNDNEIVDLIFAPGFSTAKEVTGMSGRGVGMDVVRTGVERLGGTVQIESRSGIGTNIRFVLPFTVVMSRLMTVEAGGQVFGLPLDAVVESVRIPRSQISPVGAARAFVLRNQTIPICNLAQTLKVAGTNPQAPDATLVIATINGQLAALEVDRVGERMDIMLKPLEGLLSGMVGVAGTTLLGDGRILIVLDLQELLQ